MKKFKSLSLVLVLAMIFTSLFSGFVFAAVDEVDRLSGSNRIETAVKIAEAGWADGADAVVIAAGQKAGDVERTATLFADALAGAPLAAALDAPILLVNSNPEVELAISVQSALLKLNPAEVYILGGEDAVPAEVVEAIQDLLGLEDDAFVRLEGKNRYETAEAIADEVTALTGVEEALEVNGLDFGEALAVSSYAAEAGIPMVYRRDTVEVDVYELSVEYAAKFEDAESIIIATGTAFADAFAAAPYAAKINAPVVLVPAGELPEATVAFLEDNAGLDFLVLGGTSAVSAKIADAVKEALAIKAVKIENVTATGVKNIKVVFNKPVDTAKVSFGVKKSNIANNIAKVEWNDAKTEATLTMSYKLTNGEYEVTANVAEEVLVGKAAVADEKVAKIELLSDKLVISKDDMTEATVGFAVYNQYGEEMKTYDIDWNSSVGVPAVASSTLTFTNASKFAIDQKVVITALEKTHGLFISGTVTVSRQAYVSEVAIGEVKTDKDNIVLNETNLTNYYVPVVLKDQYGNVIKSKDVAIAQLLQLNSNITGSFDNDGDGNLIFKFTGYTIPGTATITFVTVNAGNRATRSFEILKDSIISDFSLEFPEVMAVGDKVDVKFVALDQYGKPVTNVTTLNTMIHKAGISGNTNVKETDFTFAKDYKSGDVKLTLDLSRVESEEAKKIKAGKAYLSLITDNAKYYTTNFDIKEARAAVLVKGTKDLVVNMVVGSTQTVKKGNIVLLDQLGKDMEIAGGTNVTLESSDASILSITGSPLTASNSLTFTANKKGTVTITAKIVGKEESTFTFALNVVEASAVKNYAIADFPVLYKGMTKDVTLTGTLEDGSKVVLNNNVILDIVSTNAGKLTVDKSAKEVTAEEGSGDDITVAIVVTIEGADGPVIVTKDIKISYTAPYAASISATDAVENGIAYLTAANDKYSDVTTATLKGLFAQKDQYGQDYDTDNATLTVIKSNSNSDGTEYSVIAITASGKSATIKVVASK